MNPLSTDSCLLFQDSAGENIRQGYIADNGYILYTLEPFWYIGYISAKTKWYPVSSNLSNEFPIPSKLSLIQKKELFLRREVDLIQTYW